MQRVPDSLFLFVPDLSVFGGKDSSTDGLTVKAQQEARKHIKGATRYGAFERKKVKQVDFRLRFGNGK
jgi:hypothetical protein